MGGNAKGRYFLAFEGSIRIPTHLWYRAYSAAFDKKVKAACYARYKASYQRDLEYKEKLARKKALEANRLASAKVQQDASTFWSAQKFTIPEKSSDQRSKEIRAYTKSLSRYVYGQQSWKPQKYR